MILWAAGLPQDLLDAGDASLETAVVQVKGRLPADQVGFLRDQVELAVPKALKGAPWAVDPPLQGVQLRPSRFFFSFDF